jgi:hypothetical protein
MLIRQRHEREREGAIVVLLGNVVGGVYRFFVR